MERPVVAKPGAVYFAERDRQWVEYKWAIIRDAQQQADKAVKKWRRVSAEVNDYLDTKGITGIVERSKIRKENLTLPDLLETAKWFRNEAQAHMADVSLFLQLKEAGLL